MPEHTSILNLILESIFIGFGLVVPIVALLKTADLHKLKFKELFILTAVQAVRVGGIIYFLFFAVKFILAYYRNDYTIFFSAPHLLEDWLQPVIYFSLSQWFWFKNIYISKLPLVILALLILLCPLLPALWFYLSFDGEYISIEWQYLLLSFLLNIIVFIFIIFTIMLAGNKFKKIKE